MDIETIPAPVRRTTSILSMAVVLSFSLAYLFISAQAGRIVPTMMSALAAWFSYLIIHYVDTGEVIDTLKTEKHLPESDSDWTVFGLSSFLFITGMAFGGRAVSNTNLLEATMGAGILITGYFIAHDVLAENLV